MLTLCAPERQLAIIILNFKQIKIIYRVKADYPPFPLSSVSRLVPRRPSI